MTPIEKIDATVRLACRSAARKQRVHLRFDSEGRITGPGPGQVYTASVSAGQKVPALVYKNGTRIHTVIRPDMKYYRKEER